MIDFGNRFIMFTFVNELEHIYESPFPIQMRDFHMCDKLLFCHIDSGRDLYENGKDILKLNLKEFENTVHVWHPLI